LDQLLLGDPFGVDELLEEIVKFADLFVARHLLAIEVLDKGVYL